MKAEFVPNQCLGLVKTTNQHNELKTKILVSKKTGVLHLSNLNLDFVLPEVSLNVTSNIDRFSR